MPLSYLFRNVRAGPIHLTTYRANKTSIYMVNKSISNNIRQTYKCHTLTLVDPSMEIALLTLFMGVGLK